MNLTPAQRRVLRHLARYGAWHCLSDIDTSRLLEPDDVVVVPSLVEMGLIEYDPGIRAMRLNAAGHVVVATQMKEQK